MPAINALTKQQRAVAVLAAILTAPGLTAATWTIWPDALCAGQPKLQGQLHGEQSHTDVHAAIDAYLLAFELSYDDEKYLTATDRTAAFTKICATGVVDGVHIKIWGATR